MRDSDLARAVDRRDDTLAGDRYEQIDAVDLTGRHLDVHVSVWWNSEERPGILDEVRHRHFPSDARPRVYIAFRATNDQPRQWLIVDSDTPVAVPVVIR